MSEQKRERYISHDPESIVWLRLKRLENEKLCRKLLNEQPQKLDDEILDKKAIGLSSAIKSSLGFWNKENNNLNNWILSRYYALLQMTIAEQVASLNNIESLSDIQDSTKHGHGLKAYWGDETDIEKFSIYVNNSGYFNRYLEYLGINAKELKIVQNIKKQSDYESNKDKVISLYDLFRRIPELSDFTKEYISMPSLAFDIAHSFKNQLEAEKRMNEDLNQHRGGFKGLNAYKRYGETYVDIYNTDYSVNELEKMLPFTKIEYAEKDNRSYYTGLFKHDSEIWWSDIKTYKSAHCGTHYVVPVFGQVQDIILIHFMILYGLSIIVRYYPDLYHEIEVGKYSYLAYMLKHYLIIFDNTVPLMMLERISKTKIDIATPGSWNAPI